MENWALWGCMRFLLKPVVLYGFKCKKKEPIVEKVTTLLQALFLFEINFVPMKFNVN